MRSSANPIWFETAVSNQNYNPIQVFPDPIRSGHYDCAMSYEQ